jgi:hypothetical protein
MAMLIPKFKVGQRVGVYASHGQTDAKDGKFESIIPVTVVEEIEFEPAGKAFPTFVVPMDSYFYKLEDREVERYHESFLYPVEDDKEESEVNIETLEVENVEQ